MNHFRDKEKEKRGSDGGDREAAGANLGGIVAALSILMVIAASVMVAAQLPPTPSGNDSINESAPETDVNKSSPSADLNESTLPPENVNVSEDDTNIAGFNHAIIIQEGPEPLGGSDSGSWYFKSGYENYAPSGMPDFDQKQDNWTNAMGQWTFCGPVAVANCFWWFDSKYANQSGIPGDGWDNFPLVRDYTDNLTYPPVPPFPTPFPGSPWLNDDHRYDNVDNNATQWQPAGSPPALPPFVPGNQNPPLPIAPWGELVERLAWCMDTDGSRTGSPHSGTNVFDMQACIDNWLNDAGLENFLYEHTVKMPEFEYIEEEIERSQDVILLLGFWENQSGEWKRIGGHYVTCAGVDSPNRTIAISDPFFDNAVAGGPGRIVPNPHPAGYTSTFHNNAQYVSHDYYYVASGSPSPGGIEYIPDYGSGYSDWVLNFTGLNCPEEFESMQGVWQNGSIKTEIEYAVIISPKCIEVNKTVWNGSAWVDDIAANLNDTLRFRLWVHNTGACDCNLTNITVTDIMSCSLNYSDDATPREPNEIIYYPCNNTTLVWNFPGLELEPCQNIAIEFNATVVRCPGVDTNTVNVTAECEQTVVSAEDSAKVAVMPTPFLIYGWVFNTTDQPLLNPNVTVKNLNTSEEYMVETNTSYNYYQVITSSCNVSEGDVLYFNVSDNGNSTNRTVTVTSQNMTDGGLFEQNLTIQLPQVGICGDVNDDGEIDMADVMTLWYDFADYPYPGAHTIANAWAADVNCDGEIDMADVMTLWYDFADYPYPGAHVVNCC